MEKLASIKAAADSAATPGMRQKVPTFGFGRARSATPNAERHTGFANPHAALAVAHVAA